MQLIDENNCCTLEEQKKELDQEDIFFTATNSIDALFSSWKNLFSSSQNEAKTEINPSDSEKSDDFKSKKNKYIVAPTRLYINEAFIDIYNKNDVTRAKRFAKMFRTCPIYQF